MKAPDFLVGDIVTCAGHSGYAGATFVIHKIEGHAHWVEGIHGWFPANQMKLVRRPPDWHQPCEIDDGTPVTIMQIYEHTVLIRIDGTPNNRKLELCGLRRGVTTGARRKGQDAGMLTANHAFHVRNRAMRKRSGYLLISVGEGTVEFFPTLEEASARLHSDALAGRSEHLICTCEQQADSEGGLFRTTNVGGPVEPLPKTTVVERCVYLDVSGRPNLDQYIGEKVEFTFTAGKLTGVKML